ncbi:hypothetical protein Micbo1qcDRAFT_177925 [Microdochium bolleyi]|uniref:3-dehydroquinate synthase n=1 Tax=Microdochium bolleyi TaxID=196109 RepID=A0A136IVG8_9PEZI|nr:hypothetical protein Micbo1qcDRAFT_177925 [Microdochium bolleyi]
MSVPTSKVSIEAGDGVHEWRDDHGNYGFELQSRVEWKVAMVRTRHTFENTAISQPGHANSLSSYLRGPAHSSKARKVCVAIDTDMPGDRTTKITSYLARCKEDGHIQDFSITQLAAVSSTAKTLDMVYTVIEAAEKLALRRRDLFLAVGSTLVAEIVGFAAGTYRRATPWVCVASDAEGAARWDEHDFSLSVNYESHEDTTKKWNGLLNFVHPPLAAFLDLDAVEDGGVVNQDLADTDYHEHIAFEKVQYHVAAVSDLLKASNKMLIDGYCQPASAKSPKRKILVVVEAHLGTSLSQAVDNYFAHYADKIDSFRLLSMHVSGHDKDMGSVQRILDAAIAMGMSRTDLFLVIGGGTLMDAVGFAAAMYKGGTPYLRVPTTLVGMIDAGIGVKVGVNFGTHKNFIGRYYAPVACLNDAATFLPTLSRREYACGLAEALKMACMTSPRLFDVIEAHQQDLGLNAQSHEMILLAIRTMLEELQPNIYEHSLVRLVDFGHEFGHIIESLARFLVPHGECVAMGMAISSYLAYLKGRLSRQALERILDCTLSLGLPIWSAESGCCDAEVLWAKISAEGIEHKDGMLYLAVPEGAIGQGGFIDDIVDIDADMLRQTVQGLQHYSTYLSMPLPFDASSVGTWTKANSSVEAASTPQSSSSLRGSIRLAASSAGSSKASLSSWDEEDGADYSALTAAVIGASGDIGSALVQYLLDRGAKVIATIRPHVHDEPHNVTRGRLRIPEHPSLHVLVGYPLDTALLSTVIQDADVIYNMAAVVSLSLAAADRARVIGLNGFGQGVISCMLRLLGREKQVKVVYPSSQRVHLTLGHKDIDDWVAAAGGVFSRWSQETLTPIIAAAMSHERDGRESQQVATSLEDLDMAQAMETLAADFLADHPLPPSVANIYELSKRLGEHLAALSPRCVLARISGVYGPTFTRGFAARAARPKSRKSFEAVELRDFIYVDDLNKILIKAAVATQNLSSLSPDGGGDEEKKKKDDRDSGDVLAFDVASGEATDLRAVWRMARELTGDGAQVVFDEGKKAPEAIKLDTRVARELLGRDFMSFEQGFRRMIDGRVRARADQELATFPLRVNLREGGVRRGLDKNGVSDPRVSSSCAVTFRLGPDGSFCFQETEPATFLDSGLDQTFRQALERWYTRLPGTQKRATAEYIDRADGLTLRPKPSLYQGAEFKLERDTEKDLYRPFLDISPDLVDYTSRAIEDMIGQAGHHLLAFLSRSSRPPPSRWDHEREQRAARSWDKFLQPWASPPVIVLDVGSTSMRTAVYGPNGELLAEPSRTPSPSRHSSPPGLTVAELQARLVDTIAREVATLRASHRELDPRHVAIGIGAVIDRKGVIRDASIFWGAGDDEDAYDEGYDLRAALEARLPPDTDVTIINDVSAAAWRYHDQGRFCLITASSGLANKVFDKSLGTGISGGSGDPGEPPDGLVLGAAGLGGEMGHVVVEPRLVDEIVAHARAEATRCPAEFSQSLLSTAETAVADQLPLITARTLGSAAARSDAFATRVLRDRQLPVCACGTIADLCSYSSGRGVLERVRTKLLLAAGGDRDHGAITDSWLRCAIRDGHPLALEALDEAARALALRVLHMAADLGLETFILVGGFALKTARDHLLPAVQAHLARLCTYTAFFRGWTKERVRSLVRLGEDDDDDVLLGLGRYVHEVRMRHYRAVVKPVGGSSLSLAAREVPRVGEHEVLARMLYAGVCSTDLQILRGDRGLEPGVLGHEGVCEVIEVGRQVKGVERGQTVVLLPNNPLDDSEKLGHNREGLLQEYFKFGQEMIDRGQVLPAPSAVSPVMTLVEPLSCVVAAQELITPARVVGKNVLVVGAGTLGLLFATVSASIGARGVFLASRSAESLNFAVVKGVVARNNTIAMEDDHYAEGLSKSIQNLTSGQGIDTVIICVSLGQGCRVAQDALSYVNDGGFVHLFGGFESKDMLTLTIPDAVGDDRKAIWPIRAEWRTENVQTTAGCPSGHSKTVTLSGNRGSRGRHAERALELLRRNGPAFSRVISHCILLDTVPKILVELSVSGRVRGAVAKRVIVDMSSDRRRGQQVVQSLDELTLQLLNDAAGHGSRHTVPTGNIFRDLAFDGDNLVLGWVTTPTWQQVRRSVQEMLQVRAVARRKRHCIFVGTGPWAFWIDLLTSTLPQPQPQRSRPGLEFHNLCSLDSRALLCVLEAVSVDGLDEVLCVGTTQSGTTTETVALMDTLRERFDLEGLDYRDHFVWLTDRVSSVRDTASGEAIIRDSKAHDWTGVDVIPLTLRDQIPINALFGVPYSSLVFLSIVLRLESSNERDPLPLLRELYDEYTCSSEAVLQSYLSSNAEAVTSACTSTAVNLHIILPDCIAAGFGAERLATQLFQQALGSKDAGFHVRVRATAASAARIETDTSDDGFLVIPAPTVPPGTSHIVTALVTINALSFICAMIAAQRGIEFVTHPSVDMYKQRARELMLLSQASEPGDDDDNSSYTTSPRSSEEDLCKLIALVTLSHLDTSSSGIRFLDIIPYGHEQQRVAASVRDTLAGKWRGRDDRYDTGSIRIIPGEYWNHSEFPSAVAVAQRGQDSSGDDTLRVFIIPPGPRSLVTNSTQQQQSPTSSSARGISEQTLAHSVRLMRTIGLASAQVLGLSDEASGSRGHNVLCFHGPEGAVSA